MSDRVLGAGILLASVIGIAVYFWLIFMSSWSVLTVQLTAFMAVGGLLAIVAWIGYTLATTPTPEPIGDIVGDIETTTTVEDAPGEREDTPPEEQ